MNRRQLLKQAGFLTSSVAVFGLSACNSNNDSDSKTTPSKLYSFPQGVMAADPKPNSIILWTRVVAPNDDPIAQTASGRPDIEVSLELAANNSFATLLTPAIRLSAKAIYDNSIRHKLTGLSPATEYYYRFRSGTGISRVGRFKTAPALDADPSSLKFAFMACQDWSVNHWLGLSALVQQDLDFVVHLGDYIYEAAGDSYQSETVEAAHDAIVIPSQTNKPNSTTAKVATTLEDYRYLYKKYRTDSRLQALHARFALVAVWDDHEFSDDCWQNNETYTNGSVKIEGGLPLSPAQITGSDTTSDTNRRRAANRAWFEFMPADIPTLDETVATNFETVKIYRDLQFGKLAHLVMTDERLYRADHVIPEALDNPLTPLADQLGSIGTRYFVPEPSFAQLQGGKMLAAIKKAITVVPEGATKTLLQSIDAKLSLDPTGSTLTAQEFATFNEVGLPLVSILGETQRNWWKNKMATSTATWKFWGNEVSLLRMALNLKALAGVVAAGESNPALAAMINSYIINADQWDGYSAERSNLMSFLTTNNIKNVVAVTGDIHAFFAGEVAANYASYSAGNAAMVDLVTAGISSSSFWSYLASVVGDFQQEVDATLQGRTANPSTYLNLLESGDNPFVALRPLVYTCPNMLIYQNVKSAVLAATPAEALSTEAGKAAVYRAVFEQYLTAINTSGTNNAIGYNPINTLNETLAGEMGKTIQGLALSLGQTIPNPYTSTPTKPSFDFPPVQNPWLKYVETKTQGFITVNVSPNQVVATYHHIKPLAANPTASEVIDATKTKTITINKNSTLLTLS
ncbi:alkaline phosphatase D family protein [Agitococcus lubricus]|uniref:Alkaline phosphatase D n=1 Tax=Agitococcus lubricus TaxID=1077255 RepID=A0A2T5J2S3_9GAMM|nr:alkaline phosphatase D family protein [Agitococcus lubricus]PTQ90828.1 alkaline phosphatase D [Agitococcus lubricus]